MITGISQYFRTFNKRLTSSGLPRFARYETYGYVPTAHFSPGLYEAELMMIEFCSTGSGLPWDHWQVDSTKLHLEGASRTIAENLK